MEHQTTGAFQFFLRGVPANSLVLQQQIAYFTLNVFMLYRKHLYRRLTDIRANQTLLQPV